MEGLTSENSKNPGKIMGKDDLFLLFGNLRLGKDGTLRPGAPTRSCLPNVNGSSISDSKRVDPSHSWPENNGVCMNSQSIMNSWVYAPETTYTAPIMPSFLNSVSDRVAPNHNPLAYAPEICGSIPTFLNSVSNVGNILGDNYFMSGGTGCLSDVQNHGHERFNGFFNYEDKYVNCGYASENLVGSSLVQSRMNSLGSCLSTSNFANGPSFGFDNVCYQGLGGIEDDGFYQECATMRNTSLSSEEWEMQMDKIRTLDLLKWSGPKSKDYMCSLLQDFMPRIFRDRMYLYFIRLLDFWEDKHLKKRIPEILSENELFMNAVFSKDGSNAVVKLIKRIRKLGLAYTLTEVLSTRFYDIMTHPIARAVIQQCFNFFTSGPNEILYEEVTKQYRELATHEVGCRSLNECINTISGDQRMKLLNDIAEISDYLSNDPYGNYVVQHVLGLKNDPVTNRILNRLQGQFTSLGQKKGGSHVVEKCMESSDDGMVFVVQEILEKPERAFLLARDQFGNYVIQKALEKTKKQGYNGLYTSLVQALESHRSQLNYTAGGKHVLNILGYDVRSKRQGTANGKNPSKVKANRRQLMAIDKL